MKYVYPILFLLLASGAAAPVANGQTPSAAVELAAVDAAKLREPAYARYLAMPHVPAADRKQLEQWDAVLRFWANSLSREADIEAPARVGPNLWRVDLRDYQWDARVWEKLAEKEPWFLVKLVTVGEAKPARTVKEYWQGGTNPADGKYYAPGWYDAQYPATKGGKVVKAAFGPWVAAGPALKLANLCQSQVPIVRLDWWLATASLANDKGTGYYDWLGLGKAEKDFQALVGADVKAAQRLRREIGALVSDSSVTLNNRALERFDAITGPYWRSRDFDGNDGEKNVLRLLDGDIKEDASEQYGSLPNRLWAFWLQNGKGERQDTAPDFIASDGKATTPDRRVKTGLSCVRCHVEGIRPIDDWARAVYQPPFRLQDRLYEETKRKRSKYLSDLEGAVEEDQQRYAKVLKRVNGLTPADNAKLVADLYDAYAVRKRSLADVAVEMGYDEKTLTAALKAAAAAQGIGFDPVLAGLVQGRALRVEHLEELVPLMYEIVGKYGSKP